MNNKYQSWYNQITENAKSRLPDGYTETHHILPKSMGGADSPENTVELTAREHFVCHWLLTKMTEGDDHYKMLNALRIMRAESPRHQRYKTKITARVYANLKEEYAQLQSERVSGENNPMYGKPWTEEQKLAHSRKIKGRKQPPEEKERQLAAQVGRTRAPFSDEWRANLSKSRQGEKNHRYGVEVSEETRKKISEKAKLRRYTAETNEQRRQTLLSKNLKREKLLCPHCQQLISVNTYPRWHGDNCKHRK